MSTDHAKFDDQEQKVQHDLALLRTRTVKDLLSLHIVVTEDLIYCLDLSLITDTLDKMNLLCLNLLRAYSPDTVLPSAAEMYWRQLSPHKTLHWLKRYNLNFIGKHGYIGVAVVDGIKMNFNGKGFPNGMD